MQRPLPLMFIVSMLAASVAFAEPPAHASRYQPDMGARYGRDRVDGNRPHDQPRERDDYGGHASGTYSQRPEAGARYRDYANAQPIQPARGPAYAAPAGQWRNADRPFQSDRRGDDRRESRYPRPGYGDDHRDGREDYRRAGWTPDRHDWDDERGHSWHHDRDWYDRYRVDHFRYYGNRYYARQRFSIGFYSAPWGYRTRLWACGDRLPLSYYSARYVLDDYYSYDLYAPSYATAWVRVGNDVLLIDLENGEVLDVVADLFW